MSGVNFLVNSGKSNISSGGLKLVDTYNAYEGRLGSDTFGVITMPRGIFYAIQSDLGGTFSQTINQTYFPTNTQNGFVTNKILLTQAFGNGVGALVSTNQGSLYNIIDKNGTTFVNPSSFGGITASFVFNTFNTYPVYFTSGNNRKTYLCSINPNKISVVFEANASSPIYGFEVYKIGFDSNKGLVRSSLIGSNQNCAINNANKTIYSSSLVNSKAGSLFEVYFNQSPANVPSITEIEMYGTIEFYEFID